MRTPVVIVALLLVGCRPGAEAAARPDPEGPAPMPVVTLTTPGGRAIAVAVELAVTPEDRERGLMHREHLEAGRGMLFVFADDRVRTFWMRNTLIPLDMIFIDRDGTVVGVVHEAEPLTETTRSVSAPSRYVLEVPGGWARASGVGAGTRARFPALPEVVR